MSLPATGRLRSLLAGWRPAHYAILLLVHMDLLCSGGRAGSWDWYQFIYPWADALRLTIVKYHQFPWWNAWLFSGEPFLAEPQTALLTPDTLFIVAFGAVAGYKLIVLFWAAVGYEGSRFLCRQLFGRRPLVDALSIIPALSPALALHLSVGHAVLVAFWLFPWLLALSLTWQQSAPRAVALGVVVGCFFLTYIHYTIIIGFTIVAPIVLLRLIRGARSPRTWRLAGLVVCTALAMGFTRLVLAAQLISGFPRMESTHYPIVATLSDVAYALVQPLQTRLLIPDIDHLRWWEVGSYVGLTALLLALVGFLRGDRRLRLILVAALLCFVFSWNNRDRFFPGTWMHVIPPWRYMVIAPRWRLFGCYFVLLGAVEGLLAVGARGRVAAAVLAVFVVGDLGLNTWWASRDTYTAAPPPWQMAPDPPRTVRDTHETVWPHVRMNLVAMGPEVPLLGWREHYPKRDHLDTPGYRGDFVGTRPVTVESWSPNRIVLIGFPGDTLTLNINPGSYWLMNGQRLFPEARPMEIEQPFHVVVPPGGRVELVARPPHVAALLLIQALFALGAVLLYRRAGGRN